MDNKSEQGTDYSESPVTNLFWLVGDTVRSVWAVSCLVTEAAGLHVYINRTKTVHVQ